MSANAIMTAKFKQPTIVLHGEDKRHTRQQGSLAALRILRVRERRDAHLSRSSHTGSSFSALPMMTGPVAWRRVESWMRREVPEAHRLLGAVRKRCSVGRWIERWGRWHRSIHVVGAGGEWLAWAASDTPLCASLHLLGPSLINNLRLKSYLTWPLPTGLRKPSW